MHAAVVRVQRTPGEEEQKCIVKKQHGVKQHLEQRGCCILEEGQEGGGQGIPAIPSLVK